MKHQYKFSFFDYKDWENCFYDGLLAYLHDNYPLNVIENYYNKKLLNLDYIDQEYLYCVFNGFKDMTIFRSNVDIEIMKGKMFCEYCPLYSLREVIEKKYLKKISDINCNDDMIDEALEMLILKETISTHKDKEYKSILRKFLN